MARDDHDEGALTQIARGFRKRTLKTVGLASKVGLRALKKQLDSDSPIRPSLDGKVVDAAWDLFEKLDDLKGLVMKFGQMASYLDATLPPEAREVLARLQSQSRPMAFETIETTVREAFDAEVDELFDDFEREPFAAASIGQVHRARFESRDVAVKVQYPGVEAAIASDLKTLRAFAQLGTLFSAMDGKALAFELRDRVLQECNYLAEADNQRLFRRLLDGDDRVAVPEVIAERTRRRVLTSELVRGRSFQAFCEEATKNEKDRAGALIFEVAFTSIFRHCVFNADPHPGNYLFPDDGRVVFLDFGCIRRFDAAFIDLWKRLAKAIIGGDRAAFRQLYVQVGFVPKPKRFDWDYQWEVIRYIYEPFTTTRPFTFTPEYVQRSYDLMIWRNPNRLRTGMPPHWLFLNRLQWGLNSVLALLRASGPWPELFRRVIESPTEPVAAGGRGEGEARGG